MLQEEHGRNKGEVAEAKREREEVDVEQSKVQKENLHGSRPTQAGRHVSSHHSKGEVVGPTLSVTTACIVVEAATKQADSN